MAFGPLKLLLSRKAWFEKNEERKAKVDDAGSKQEVPRQTRCGSYQRILEI